MYLHALQRVAIWLYNKIISVPVRLKITGIILITVLTVGLTLNYWVTASLSDWLSYILTDVRVEAAMRAGNRSIVLITILAAAGSLVIASFLTFLLTRPLVDLRDMALRVSQGNLEARAPVWARDEIGEVALAINSMTDHLVDVQSDLARTNRRLATANRIMVAAEREEEIHDVLFVILQSILDVLGLETGWIYLRDPERNLFHLASWYGVPPEMEADLLQEGREAACDCQRHLIDGLLPSSAHVCPCARLPSDGQLTHPNHVTIPIEARGQKYGVINLLCHPEEEVNSQDLEMLSSLGTQVSEIVANAWLRLKLAEQEAARQMLLESLVEAQEEERGRLARELHDGAGQMLTTLLVRLKTLEKQCDSPQLQTGLHSLLDLVSDTVEQVRELSYRLRPAALEEFGLPVALHILVEEMTQDVPVQATYYSNLAEETLPAGTEVTLYRIAQEALTNVLRHARAENVQVTLLGDQNGVRMTVVDDGCGFDLHHSPGASDQRHLGLISMRERAAMARGSLTVDSSPGQGTTLLVRVPLLEGLPT